MASDQDRREFGSRNADAVPPPLPSIPKVSRAIRDGLGGKFKKEWDKFDEDWEEWRKKVTLPSTAATSVPITPIQTQDGVTPEPEPSPVEPSPVTERIIERTEVRVEVQVPSGLVINQPIQSSLFGSVLFVANVGNEGVLSQNNLKLFWDNANGRLGIGKNTPVVALDVLGGLNVSGNVGIDNVNPPAQLTVNPTPAIASYNPANWNGTGRKLPLLVATEAHNGGSAIAVAEPALVLGREGIAGQAYANFVEFNLRRYENSGTASRTGLDIALTHGDGEVLGLNIMTLLSNGNVGIGLTLPLSPLHVKSAGFFQLTVESSASSAGINFKPSAGASVELQNSGTSVFLYDRTNSHYLMWLATNGNLGLGLDNTNPAAMLDVDGDAIISGSLTLANTGLHLLDTNASHDLIIAPGSNITADRTLTLTTGDVDRMITLTGNPTLADWFDQSVKSGASPQFAMLQVNGQSSLNGISLFEDTAIIFGSAGDIGGNSGIIFVNGAIDFTGIIRVNGDDGATGSFTTTDLKTVTVTNGIITTIV